MANIKDALNQLGFIDKKSQTALIKILNIIDPTIGDIDKKKFDSTNDACEWLKNITQENFIKRGNDNQKLDYIQLSDDQSLKDNRNKIIGLLKTVGTIDQVNPEQNHYKYGMLLGAMEYTVKTRINHLKETLDNDIKIDNLALLGSNRMLSTEREKESIAAIIKQKGYCQDKSEEDIKTILDNVSSDEKDAIKRNIDKTNLVIKELGITHQEWPTEIDMIKYLVDKDDKLSKINKIEISAPMYSTGKHDSLDINTRVPINSKENNQLLIEGKLRRANTADTINNFLENNEVKKLGEGNVLAVSNQPYIIHQNAQIVTLLPKEFPVETIGPKVKEENIRIVDGISSIAKSIYARYDKMQKDKLLDKSRNTNNDPVTVSSSSLLCMSNLLGIPKAKNNSLKQELGNKKRSFVESLEGEKKDFKKTRSR